MGKSFVLVFFMIMDGVVFFVFFFCLIYYLFIWFKKAREPGRVVFPIPILPRHHPPSMEKIINVRKISN